MRFRYLYRIRTYQKQYRRWRWYTVATIRELRPAPNVRLIREL